LLSPRVPEIGENFSDMQTAEKHGKTNAESTHTLSCAQTLYEKYEVTDGIHKTTIKSV